MAAMRVTGIGNATIVEQAGARVAQGRRSDMAKIGGPEDGPVVGYKVGTTMYAVVRCLRHAHTLRGLVMKDSTFLELRKYVFGVLAKKVCMSCLMLDWSGGEGCGAFEAPFWLLVHRVLRHIEVEPAVERAQQREALFDSSGILLVT